MSLMNASPQNAPSKEDRQRLQELLIAGSESTPAAPADREYFKSLRTHARKRRG